MKISKIEGSPYWQIEEDMICPIDSTLVCPRFFITDFASVPSFARCVVDNDDPDILIASVFHDLLYFKGFYHRGYRTRKQCDQLLYDLCIYAGMSQWKASAVFWSVRIGGSDRFRK